jgi:glyoxylase-like metal-dependent hydrolase (beta-lactamase superfamily II)
MHVQAFFNEPTFTLTYVVYDAATRDAVVIDPVLDYDALGSRTSTESVDRVTDFLKVHRLRIHYTLETHPHADHLSGAQLMRRRFDAKLAISEHIVDVQAVFKRVLDLPESFQTDGSQFDVLLHDGDVLHAGSLEVRVIATPGHTPACASYQIGDAVFVGDALFMEDYGTGRCDFPLGSAEALYESITGRLYALPGATRVFVGHDYLPNGRELRFESTIAREKHSNRQLKVGMTRDEFVAFRQERDATLAPPRLLYQSVQINVNGGRLPAPHANGMRYLVMPLNRTTPLDDAGESSD